MSRETLKDNHNEILKSISLDFEYELTSLMNVKILSTLTVSNNVFMSVKTRPLKSN